MEKQEQNKTTYNYNCTYCFGIYVIYNLFWKFLDIYEKKYDSKKIDELEKRIKNLEMKRINKYE